MILELVEHLLVAIAATNSTIPKYLLFLLFSCQKAVNIASRSME
jgi:hypothetical protein